MGIHWWQVDSHHEGPVMCSTIFVTVVFVVVLIEQLEPQMSKNINFVPSMYTIYELNITYLMPTYLRYGNFELILQFTIRCFAIRY